MESYRSSHTKEQVSVSSLGEKTVSYAPLDSLSQKQGYKLNKYALYALCSPGKL